MNEIPEPNGPHRVGSCACGVTDRDRAAHVLSQDRGRKLYVKIWYPADPIGSGACERERLWEELRSEPHVPGIARLLLRPAMKTMTNSHRRAPYAADALPPRVLIYGHGLISFASENSMLMEHLASHGYVVISLQHRSQLEELRELQKSQHEDEKREQAELERKIKAAAGEERAALWRQYFRAASNTNRIVVARAVDVEFAVRRLDDLLDAIPAMGRASSPEVAGVLGLSLGGAVATEFARRNATATGCAVNIDGGIYGMQLDEPISARYLMLYSQQNSGSNDLSLNVASGVELAREVVPGTRHLNFHDIAAIYPRLRWLGVIGSARPMAVVEQRNRTVSDFVGK